MLLRKEENEKPILLGRRMGGHIGHSLASFLFFSYFFYFFLCGIAGAGWRVATGGIFAVFLNVHEWVCVAFCYYDVLLFMRSTRNGNNETGGTRVWQTIPAVNCLRGKASRNLCPLMDGIICMVFWFSSYVEITQDGTEATGDADDEKMKSGMVGLCGFYQT